MGDRYAYAAKTSDSVAKSLGLSCLHQMSRDIGAVYFEGILTTPIREKSAFCSCDYQLRITPTPLRSQIAFWTRCGEAEKKPEEGIFANRAVSVCEASAVLAVATNSRKFDILHLADRSTVALRALGFSIGGLTDGEEKQAAQLRTKLDPQDILGPAYLSESPPSHPAWRALQQRPLLPRQSVYNIILDDIEKKKPKSGGLK